jgi:hypothetical protein
MTLQDFYKDHYTLEVTRRHELTSALAIPFGVLSLLLGGLVVVAKEIHFPLDDLKIIQLVAAVASLIAVLATTYFLFRSYFNYEYGYVPTPLEIKSYRDNLLVYYVLTGLAPDVATKTAEDETLEYIDSEYAIHTHRNTANNDKKSAFLHRANGALILSVVFTVVAGVPYIAHSIVTPAEVQKIEVIYLKEAAMATSSNNQKNSTQQQPTQQETTTPSAPVKPSPPPGRVIKEHVEPKLKN